MKALVDTLFLHVWWEYQTANDPLFARLYHYGNLAEGGAWLAVAALVFVRYLRHRRSRLEVVYALAFVLFGLSDFREAYRLESWLIWGKGMNLLALFGLRRFIVQNYYPAAKLF
jgi:hypothetical protein